MEIGFLGMQSLMEGHYVQALLYAETHTFSKDYRTKLAKVLNHMKPLILIC